MDFHIEPPLLGVPLARAAAAPVRRHCSSCCRLFSEENAILRIVLIDSADFAASGGACSVGRRLAVTHPRSGRVSPQRGFRARIALRHRQVYRGPSLRIQRGQKLTEIG